MPAGEEILNVLREQTVKDEDLPKLRKFIYEGWPDRRSNLSPELYSYVQQRDHLYEENKLFLGQKVVIYNAMRHEILTKVHEGHLVGNNATPGQHKQYTVRE